MAEETVLVTGASGYVGSRLVPELLEAGYDVRAISRTPEKLHRFSWAGNDRVELRQADALDQDSMMEACRGCSVVYYLIHSMEQGSGDFEEADRRAAKNMARSADAEGVDRIIYLGGIDPTDGEENLSKHRRSRLDVEEALASRSVPLTTFRAAMVVGSGSASFEMLRYSLERLPSVMITHTYADDPTQPIAVTNVLGYLVKCLDEEETIGETFDIGGPDIMTNREVMKTYCRVVGLAEPTIVSSDLMPLKIVSWATTLLTPMPRALVEPLVMGARHPSVCQENRITEIISEDLLTLEEAMNRATEKSLVDVTDEGFETVGPAEWPRPGDPAWSGGSHYEDERTRTVEVPPQTVWRTIRETGSRNGLFFAKWFRDLVGWVDDKITIFDFPEEEPPQGSLKEGDYLDCWVVADQEKLNYLKLRADVNLPGEATYIFRLESVEEGTRIVQKARFRPRGLRGRIYWCILSIFHVVSFPLGLRSIARRSRKLSGL